MRTALISLFLSSCFVSCCPAAKYVASTAKVPEIAREFRGVWIATVANIDWPSTNTLTTAQQKAELIALLDHAQKTGLNAVLFQVRPACDALYASRHEPWSEFLTGTMGKAPSPFFDPLGFAINEAHARGLELHAWFNPYRAHHPASKSPISPNHISKTRPDLVRKYGRHLWLDPGEKEVQDHSLKVIMDVLKNYNVDGIHFDDYFYPYKELDAAGKELDFPDAQSWKKHGAASKLSRDDWRRENVNAFVQRVHASVKSTKPWVKFGVSPFGIWRPGHPPQIKGLDAYEKLYADAQKWMANGWLDYSAPQLYWSIDRPAQSFPALLDWWSRQNSQNRHLWPGLNSYNVGRTWEPDEIINQVRLTRKHPGSNGHIHWGMRRSLMANQAFSARMRKELYSEPALTPPVPRPGLRPIGRPAVTASVSKTGTKVSWKPEPSANPKMWVVQWMTNNQWHARILPHDARAHSWTGTNPSVVAVSAVDRFGVKGPPAVLGRKG